MNGRRWSLTSLSEQLLATRQAKIEKVVEEAAPKSWRAGRKTVDGQTTVTSKPYKDGQSPEHRKLLEDNGYDPDRFKIVGPVRQTSWTAYIPEAHRDDSGEYTFQAKAYRFQVVERAEGELDIDEVLEILEQPAPEVPADLPFIYSHLDPDVPYVVAVGDTQIGKYENPLEELIVRFKNLMLRAAAGPALLLEHEGVKMSHIHLPWLGDCIEGMNSQGGKNRWRTTLPITEQVRAFRRLLLWQVRLFAPLAERLTVVSVPGNHDEANTRDLDTRVDDSWAVDVLAQVSDALELTEGYEHVECYVPGPDERVVVMEVGGTVVVHSHGHEVKRKHGDFDYWAGQTFGMQPMGQATLWLRGHGHHWYIIENGQRKIIQVPSVELFSQWYQDLTGTPGSPGIVTFQLWENELLNVSKLEPETLEEA